MSDAPAPPPDHPGPTPPSTVEIVQAMVGATPYARALDMQVVSIDNGRVCMKAPYRADLVGDPETGVVAGGVLTALLDHVCGAAAMAALKERRSVATLDLRIDYMRGAEPGRDVFAEAHCYKVTKSVAFVRAIAYEETVENPVANATGAFMITDIGAIRMGSNLKAPK